MDGKFDRQYFTVLSFRQNTRCPNFDDRSRYRAASHYRQNRAEYSRNAVARNFYIGLSRRVALIIVRGMRGVWVWYFAIPSRADTDRELKQLAAKLNRADAD